MLDLHNFVLQHYLGATPLDSSEVADGALAFAERVAPMVADVPRLLSQAMGRGDNLLFEGAQGALLDVDHGTYPFVTSSNCVAGAAAVGAGVGPQALHYVLGITKAYTTRVGSGPFPTELFDDTGKHLATKGNEFGSVTGRARRTGWFDAAALKRSIQLNGVTGLCVTKLDVLDGLAAVKICVGYREKGAERPPDHRHAALRRRSRRQSRAGVRGNGGLDRLDLRRARLGQLAGQAHAAIWTPLGTGRSAGGHRLDRSRPRRNDPDSPPLPLNPRVAR